MNSCHAFLSLLLVLPQAVALPPGFAASHACYVKAFVKGGEPTLCWSPSQFKLLEDFFAMRVGAVGPFGEREFFIGRKMPDLHRSRIGMPVMYIEIAVDGYVNCQWWLYHMNHFVSVILPSVFRSAQAGIIHFQKDVPTDSWDYILVKMYSGAPEERGDQCPTAWATESLTVSTSNSVGRQVRAEEAILRSFVHSSHGRRLADAIVQNVTVSATRNLRSSRDFICSFDTIPGLAHTDVKTFLKSKIGEIVPTFNAMTSSGVTVSDCSMLPDDGQSLRLKCSVTTEPRGRLFAGFEDFRSTLKVAVSSRVLDVSVNLLHGDGGGTKPLEISLGLDPSFQASLNVGVGALCDTFLSQKSAWDRLWQELQDEYALVGSQDAAVCTAAE